MKKKIKLKPGADLQELAYIMAHLRHWSKEWKQKFGFRNRINMNRWEDAADEWLSKNIDNDSTSEDRTESLLDAENNLQHEEKSN